MNSIKINLKRMKSVYWLNFRYLREDEILHLFFYAFISCFFWTEHPRNPVV